MSELQAVIEASIGSFPGVSVELFAGCPGLFARGQPFALVWTGGRVALRLSDAAALGELLAHPGAEALTPSGLEPGSWALVPERWRSEPAELMRWALRAHELALVAAQDARGLAEPAGTEMQEVLLEAPQAGRPEAAAKAPRRKKPRRAAHKAAEGKPAPEKGAPRKSAARSARKAAPARRPVKKQPRIPAKISAKISAKTSLKKSAKKSAKSKAAGRRAAPRKSSRGRRR